VVRLTSLPDESLAQTLPRFEANVRAPIPLFALHSPICSQLDSSAPAVTTPILLYGRLEGLMSVLSKICRRSSGLWVLAFLAAGLWTQTPARGAHEVVTISVDQAQLLNLPDRVATIIIGNPLIADATVQGGGLLVITGKGFGMTNLLALDRSGRVLMSRLVEVRGPSTSDIVTVYKGIDRESYSCSPNCERRITLGDSPAFFNATLSQSGARNGQAQGGSK
jgi:Pilus formation protein N terminal region